MELGFLTVRHDAAGFTGGYLVTNAWGRPLEFRLTTPVQPNRVQEILYGATLAEYIHADLLGRTLVEKTTTRPSLIVTDAPDVMALESRVNIPVISIAGDRGASFAHARSQTPLWANDASDSILALLNSVDSAVDLSEPFARIRDAMSEARHEGNRRAA